MWKKGLTKLLIFSGVFLLIATAVALWGKSSYDLPVFDRQGDSLIAIDTSNMKQIEFSALKNIGDAKWVKAAAGRNTELYYSETDGTIMVLDRRNNHMWLSAVDMEKYNIPLRLNDMWKYKISSLLNIKYFDLLKNEGVPVETNAFRENAYISIKRINDGINIGYVFDKIQMELHVELLLVDDHLSVRLPFNEIRENSTFKLASVEILPVFGAAGPKDDGYVFYPDGCGAISGFDSEKITGKAAQYRFNIYGNDIADPDGEAEDDRRGIKTAMLPVFGIKNGDNAFVAVISEGAADSAICYSPSGVVVDINRIAVDAVYRRCIDMSALGSSGAGNKTEEKIQKYQTEIQKKDVTVDYFFLYGQDADYSGMANTCRKYFEEKGWVQSTLDMDNGMPLAVDLFMGINEKRALFDKYIPMTEFKEAKDILEQISSMYDGKLIVSLSGWSKGGYERYPSLPVADSRLGGDTGLKKLAAFIINKNWDMYLNVNLMNYDKRNGGFSLGKDVIYYGNTLPVTDKSENLHVLNTSRFFQRYMPKYQELAAGISGGLGLSKYGRKLYVDFKAGKTRVQSAEDIAEGMAELSAKGVKLAGEGNFYMLNSVDYLMNIPQEDSGYDMTDEAVPFYQMVIHGLIPYTSEPGNLASDLRRQTLKWIEYGCVPYFFLTYQPAESLKYTSFNTLFSSSYRNWGGTIADIGREYAEKLQDLWKYRIIKHEKLMEDVYSVIYENGKKVYVNYSSKAVNVEGITINSTDFYIGY